MEKEIKILWVDDEIDLLKPYVLFLQEKGFIVSTCHNGDDALNRIEKEYFDLVFLDENMPGLSGLETLSYIKLIRPNVPIVMISKSEEENLMDDAIGSKIADYLIKPVNPKQILLTIKKNLDKKRLISEKINTEYQVQFSQINGLINSAQSFEDWINVYKKLVYWEMELESSFQNTMDEVLQMQRVEANTGFSRFIKINYGDWFGKATDKKPLLSPEIFPSKVFPLLDNGEKVFFLLVDNLRYDQWKVIEKEITGFLKVDKEEIYCSILPTATQYSRNSIFAGLMPLEINNMYPHVWLFDEEKGGKNLKEEELLIKQLNRQRKDYKFHYEKILNNKAAKKLVESVNDLLNFNLNIIVYNFVDMLSHASTDMEMIRELVNNDSAYRSLTASWFQHSHLIDLMRILSNEPVKIILTTDHGSIRVNNAIKVVGDARTSTNLRYKLGKNMDYNPRDVFEIKNPEEFRLPMANISSKYIFASSYDYMVFPKNYNYFANYFKNTFQHGGISMEEMMIPCITLRS